MVFASDTCFRETPWSSASTVATDWTLQQLAPYIGRMKTAIARFLIEEYSSSNQTIADPFCGSGVVPYEAVALGRHVIAGDVNPYALALTRAKLLAPNSLELSMRQFEETWALACSFSTKGEEEAEVAPEWVKKFFHQKTLAEALSFRDACIARNDHLSLACLLGILHHQRPGFLSYPSSHLVPYLRDKKYPRSEYPEMYEYRDVYSRMVKKIKRSFRRLPVSCGRVHGIFDADARQFPNNTSVDTIITSPPYMNLLDYGRDNRLRLWFLQGELPIHDFPKVAREKAFSSLMEHFLGHWVERVRDGGYIVLVLGDVSRGGRSAHPADVVKKMLEDVPSLRSLHVINEIRDDIPDIRRSRRFVRGGKEEIILAIKKEE
ncbi:DNA methyltransferase [Azospirillum argentinense]